MNHSFNTEVAKEVGMASAVIFENIGFWVLKNKANESHFYDNKFWTFCSVSGFSKLFAYLTEKQIRTALEKLEKHGFIETGNYNKATFDKTKWYTLTDKGYSYFSVCPNGQIDLPKDISTSATEGEPIPDINKDINKNKNNKLFLQKDSEKTENEPTELVLSPEHVEKKPRKRKKTTPHVIPDDWQPDEKGKKLFAEKLGKEKDYALFLREFIHYWKTRGEQRSGWDRTWRYWVNEVERTTPKKTRLSDLPDDPRDWNRVPEPKLADLPADPRLWGRKPEKRLADLPADPRHW